MATLKIYLLFLILSCQYSLFNWMNPMTLAVLVLITHHTCKSTFQIPTWQMAINKDERKVQWSLPHRGREGGRQRERGIQVHFSSCGSYLTYFSNHKCTFEVKQEAYWKHSHYSQQNVPRRIQEILEYLNTNDFTMTSAVEKMDWSVICFWVTGRSPREVCSLMMKWENRATQETCWWTLHPELNCWVFI